jgi:hypothetical protein
MPNCLDVVIAEDFTHPEKLPDVDIPGNFLTGLQKQKQ